MGLSRRCSGRRSMLEAIRRLFECLDAQGVEYCHWKSNAFLGAALDGEGDLDLLVRREHGDLFEALLTSLRFKQMTMPRWRSVPSVLHYLGLDPDTGLLVHLHVYLRLVTGGSLAKPCWLPLEALLLESRRRLDGVWVPAKDAELLLFVLRKMLEYSSPTEGPLAVRESRRAVLELEWLLAGGTLAQAERLVDRWLPQIDRALFRRAAAALMPSGSIPRRCLIAATVRWRLRHCMLQGLPLLEGARAARLVRWVILRCLGRPPRARPLRGGVLVAVVGPEASGKSTLVRELRDWLAQHMSVTLVHAGKPPSTSLTALPDLLLPFLRRALPRHRSFQVDHDRLSGDATVSGTRAMLYAVRAVLLASSRRRLLERAQRTVVGGALVISDRFPSMTIGAADSAQLDAAMPGSSVALLRRLGMLERRLYRDIRTPDIVFRLDLSPAMAVARNAERDKDETDAYVRHRHARWILPQFPASRVLDLDTARPLAETLLTAKQAVWECL
jgi:thymidylate kinase